MNRDEARISRRDELLADRALQGLTDEERAELEGLVADADADADGLALELAAAEAELALWPADLDDLPPSIRVRLESAADAFLRGRTARGATSTIGARAFPWLGWLTAAAALLYAARVDRPEPVPPRPATLPAPSVVERLAAVPPRPLSNTGHPLARGGGGTLVWSDERQEGYLAVRGLAEVEPAKGVYQLWIFDASRDDRFPVDGGTFTVEDAKATTLVPIKPALVVRRPSLFAVTLEPSGGVVVSDRKRILLATSPAFPGDGAARP